LGTVSVKGSEALMPTESVTCTMNCEVVAVFGTCVADSTPPLERFNQVGRLEPLAGVHVNGAMPVPALVCKIKLKLLLILATRLAGAGGVMATAGTTVIVTKFDFLGFLMEVAVSVTGRLPLRLPAGGL